MSHDKLVLCAKLTSDIYNRKIYFENEENKKNGILKQNKRKRKNNDRKWYGLQLYAYQHQRYEHERPSLNQHL